MKKHLPFSSEGSSPFLPPIFVVGFYTWGISTSRFIRGGVRRNKPFIHKKYNVQNT